MEENPERVTQLLLEASHGDQHALDAVLPIVYDELRRLARSYMRRERREHTLQTTALVHEAYLRLLGQNAKFANRGHFFAIAAKMMRRVLVDHAKHVGRAKRGGGAVKISLDEPAVFSKAPDMNLVALDEALARLEEQDPQRSKIVELRFFAGLSNEEAAQVLDISTATVQRQWAGARAWLYHELKRKE
ncbi:MAG TPA: sigma-70 family RNA polymerase sigma factor [Terriglobales bacterium]|nr:sigma-70 family RNA polymerase sigma factor [Terriglobales bacterium]